MNMTGTARALGPRIRLDLLFNYEPVELGETLGLERECGKVAQEPRRIE